MSRREIAIVVGLVLTWGLPAWAEDVTVTTYYPSPRGVYEQLKSGSLVDLTDPTYLIAPSGISKLKTLSVDTLNDLGNLTVSGTLGVTGLSTLNGGLTVTAPGATSLGGILGVTGATSLGGILGVTGATNLGGILGVTGATNLSSTLGVTGATNLSSTLGVTGATILGNGLTVNNALTTLNQGLTVTGAGTNLNAGLTVQGGETIGSGGLAVTGNSVLGNDLTVTGLTTLNGGLKVVGVVDVAQLQVSDFVKVRIVGPNAAVTLDSNISTINNINAQGSIGASGNVTSLGKIGIGTAAPVANLTVIGQATFGPTAFAPPGTEPVSTSGPGSGISMEDRNGAAPRRVIYPSGDTLRFWRSGTDQLAIDASGNVGIGTAAPGKRLDVQGGSIRTSGKIGTNGKDPDNGYPGGWGGGVHTWDVYSEATIGAGPAGGPPGSWMNASGNAGFAGAVGIGSLNVTGNIGAGGNISTGATVSGGNVTAGGWSVCRADGTNCPPVCQANGTNCPTTQITTVKDIYMRICFYGALGACSATCNPGDEVVGGGRNQSFSFIQIKDINGVNQTIDAGTVGADYPSNDQAWFCAGFQGGTCYARCLAR